MIDKKFILNADDFGLSLAHNKAVLEGYVNGFLTSASLCVNTDYFDNAIHDILPDCPNLSLGIHLNIIEGKALTDCKDLIDDSGNFNIGYFNLFMHQNDKNFLEQIENEFRAQIEKIKSVAEITHIDSHVHVHSIPQIFEIVCKLAKEYNIKYVRTQFEELYFVPNFQKNINFKFPINLIKVALLQHYTKQNRKTLKKYDLKTNDFILGIGYTGMMDSETVKFGLEQIEESSLVEAIIHPCKYDDYTKNSHSKEFSITQNMQLKNEIERLGFELTNFKSLG